MSKESSTGTTSWYPIDPHPGTFTKLCSKIGATGVQVEQIELMTSRETIRNLRPVYGLMLLVKHKPDFFVSRDDTCSNINHGLHFSNQVIHDAYALHAFLNILLNCGDKIDLGNHLNHFKEFTQDFPPSLKGLALTNSDTFRCAYNGLASHYQRMYSDSNQHQQYIYHPISYIQFNGHAWELDGLKKSPVKLGACNEDNWLDVVYLEIIKKTEGFQRQNLMASLWAIIEDRKLVYQRRLIGKNHIKYEIEKKLDYSQPGWRRTSDFHQWEEEFQYAMTNERSVRGHFLSEGMLSKFYKSYKQLPKEEQLSIELILEECTASRHSDMMGAWLQTHDDSLRLYECLGLEAEKEVMFEQHYIRTQHDYIPFIKTFIKGLLEEGHLESIKTSNVL